MDSNGNAQERHFPAPGKIVGEYEDSQRHPKGDILAEIQLTLNMIQYFNHSESSMESCSSCNK